MRILALVLLTLASSGAQASARAQLDAFSGGIEGLSATFEQRVYDSDNALRETSSGDVQLKAPRQFRWEYRKPFVQQLVADGDHIWIYEPDMEQVTVRQQSLEEHSSPLAMLIDPAELERQFTVSEDGQSEGLAWLLLTPKKPEEAPFERARLGFNPQGLARMELFDGLGQRTLMQFAGWKRNPEFAAGTFSFVPPPGIDVVGEMAEAAQVIPLQD
jgi:outer membrane lipoprotein carrier protein